MSLDLEQSRRCNTESQTVVTHPTECMLVLDASKEVLESGCEEEDECIDAKSTNSSRSKDGRFVKTGSRTVHPCPHPDCIKYFTRPSRLQTHLLSHSGVRPYNCTVDKCNKTYTRSAHLKRHLLKHHGQPAKTQDDKEDLEASENRIKCTQCPKVFSNKYSLQKHSKVHLDSQRYTCQKCGKTFHKHHFLTSHIALEHQEGGANRKITCKKCDKGFLYESQLKRHFTRHHEKPKKYKCQQCNIEFALWTKMRTHVSSAHPKIGKQCEVCKKTFFGPCATGNLQEHRATHAASRPAFHCPIRSCAR